MLLYDARDETDAIRTDRARDGTSCRRQPAGWYTLAELLDEKFVRNQAAEERKRDRERARR